VSTGASKFRVLTKQKPKPVTCPRGNPLDYQCSYEECKRCKNYICDTVWGPQNVWDYGTPCYRYFVCVPCIDKAKKAAEQAALDPSNKPTFMHCEAGCSLLLQLPRELLGDDLPDAVDDDARSLAVQLQAFSVSIEMRLDALPPPECFLSLLKFSDPSRSRRKNVANVFVDHEGRVMGQATLTPPEHKAVITKNWWHVVTIVVDSANGSMKTYVDGVPCLSESGARVVDLVMHAKLSMLGGGKEAEARGGQVRKMHVHNAAFSDEEVQQLYLELYLNNPMYAQAALTMQRVARGLFARKVAKEEADKLAEERKANRDDGDSAAADEDGDDGGEDDDASESE